MIHHLRSLFMLLFACLIFSLGFTLGQQMPEALANETGQNDDNAYLQRFERIWSLLHESYFEQPVDSEALIQAAIDGMLDTLGDEHTGYMPQDEFELLNGGFSGSYSGIGALVEAEDEKLFVVSPFDGSPAKAAGIRPGDEIVKVDDTFVSEFDDPMSAITLVRGPKGEAVTLLIRRNNETFEVVVVRDVIPLVSASGAVREDGLAYVRVAEFSQTTVTQLREVLGEVLTQTPKGLILDLRGNPGGSLDAAIGVTSEFIGEGVIMLEEWGDGRENSYMARPGGLATDPNLPLVVLVDAGSASASEIVAGAIQDRARGTLIGELTYGKGTVQNWHNLGPEHGGVRITIARWLTPDGRWIHEQGLTPDIIVENLDVDTNTDHDMQLERAVQLLLGQPLSEATIVPRRNKITPHKWTCCLRGR